MKRKYENFESEKSILDILPRDIIVFILSLISYNYIILCQVCKKFKQICYEFIKTPKFFDQWKWFFIRDNTRCIFDYIEQTETKEEIKDSFSETQFGELKRIFWTMVVSDSYEFRIIDSNYKIFSISDYHVAITNWFAKNISSKKNILCRGNFKLLFVSIFRLRLEIDTNSIFIKLNNIIFESEDGFFSFSDREKTLIRNCLSTYLSLNTNIKSNGNQKVDYFNDFCKAVSKLNF